MWWRGVRLRRLEMLGEGSQGRVYKALRFDERTRLKQTVALKILHSKTAVDQWRQEFESLVRVRSVYCAQVLFFERYRGRPALVLEYVEGASLAQLAREGHMEVCELDEIQAQVELALRDLQSHGIFHGDLSPQNVMIDIDGRVRVLDFGLANRDAVTPRFAAPERIAGARADAASDLFSLGCLLRFLGKENVAFYLHPEPSRRGFAGLTSSEYGRLRLQARVRRWLEFARGAHEIRTQQLQRPDPPVQKAFLLAAINATFLSLVSSAAPLEGTTASAQLVVRTKKWHQFELNGRSVGYSPLTLTMPAGVSFTFRWISAEDSGELTLLLRAREVRRLGDSDFSH